MLKKISELNKTVHADGDYVVIFDDPNIANSFGVNLNSAHVCTIENGELKLKDFEPAKYEEVVSVEYIENVPESIEQSKTTIVPTLTAATSQIAVDTLAAKIEPTPKPSLIKRLFLGKVINK